MDLSEFNDLWSCFSAMQNNFNKIFVRKKNLQFEKLSILENDFWFQYPQLFLNFASCGEAVHHLQGNVIQIHQSLQQNKSARAMCFKILIFFNAIIDSQVDNHWLGYKSNSLVFRNNISIFFYLY